MIRGVRTGVIIKCEEPSLIKIRLYLALHIKQSRVIIIRTRAATNNATDKLGQEVARNAAFELYVATLISTP